MSPSPRLALTRAGGVARRRSIANGSLSFARLPHPRAAPRVQQRLASLPGLNKGGNTKILCKERHRRNPRWGTRLRVAAGIHNGGGDAPRFQSTVEMRPRDVATIQRLPQRTIESTRPTPGTVSPWAARKTPVGPCNTAVPPTTSRIDQPSMVVGRVSGTAANRGAILARSWVEMLFVVATSRLAALACCVPCASSRLTMRARGPAIFVGPVGGARDVLRAAHPSRGQPDASACCTGVPTGAGAKNRADIDPPIHPRHSPTASAPLRTAG